MGLKFSVSLKHVMDQLDLTAAYMPPEGEKIQITKVDLNRPGLQFAGFFDYFDPERIQLIGRNETIFLSRLPDAERESVLEQFFSMKPVMVVLSRGIEPTAQMLEKAQKYGVPVLTTSEGTSDVSGALNLCLNRELAPRQTRHGVLVEVYGEGILLMADSGVGKSETAVELLKRGHRLIADDAVEIRKINKFTLYGFSPANIRHFLELRGIGIINVRRLFGIGAVKESQKIDMIVNLENWNPNKVYDRMGLEECSEEIMGVSVPCLTIPVKTGRNLAVIIEVAAMNNRQKRMGYNAAQELVNRLEQDALGQLSDDINVLDF
jgi:HPr kinase/phosphorylase